MAPIPAVEWERKREKRNFVENIFFLAADCNQIVVDSMPIVSSGGRRQLCVWVKFFSLSSIATIIFLHSLFDLSLSCFPTRSRARACCFLDFFFLLIESDPFLLMRRLFLIIVNSWKTVPWGPWTLLGNSPTIKQLNWRYCVDRYPTAHNWH